MKGRFLNKAGDKVTPLSKEKIELICSDKSLYKQKQPMKLLDESQSFCDGIADYLGDNQDFLVIGKFILISCINFLLFILFIDNPFF